MMTRERLPFVSGLPGEPPRAIAPVPSAAHRAGLEHLRHIKAVALDRIEDRKHLTVERFDGVERHPVDDSAVAESAVDASIIQLVDIIVSDESLKTKVTERLGRAGR